MVSYKIFLALVFLFICSCSPKQCPSLIKDGHSFGWHGRIFKGDWNDYYQCALSYMDGEFYHEAIKALDLALEQRNMDQWMAKKYGYHFVDYFPHREKGVCFYKLGYYEKARIELKRSISHEPSDKAAYYLNKVISDSFRTQQVKASIPKVQIHNINHKNELWTNSDPVIIAGNVFDPHFIDNVMLNTRELLIDKTNKNISFSEKFDLDEGKHRIKVQASSLMDKSIQKEFLVCVDRSGPLISLQKISKQGEIKGFLFDETDDMILFVNQTFVPIITENHEARFQIKIKPDQNHVTLCAIDMLGNKTVAQISTDDLSNTKFTKPLFAESGIYMSDIGRDSISHSPSIDLNQIHDNMIVFSEMICINGRITASCYINRIYIQERQILKKKSKDVFFNQQIRLKQGDNKIRICVVGEKNESAIKVVNIRYQMPEIYLLKYRYKLQFASFDVPSSVTGMQNYLYQSLIKKKRFQVCLTNDDMQFDQPPDAFVFGVVYLSTQGIEIVVRLVDPRSSRIFVSEGVNDENDKRFITISDVYSEKYDVSTCKFLYDKLSLKLHRAVPLVEGRIVDTQVSRLMGQTDNKIMSYQHLHKGFPLLIYRKTYPLLKEFGFQTDILAHACIGEIEGKHQYSIKVNNRLYQDLFKQSDRFITK